MKISERINLYFSEDFLKFARYVKSKLTKIYFNLYRFFKNPDSSYLAIGESKEYFPPPYWTLMDIKESDINVNFEETNYKVNNSQLKFIYSSHCIEHLSDDAINYLFNELFISMKQDSVLRIETPDVKKIIGDIKDNRNIDYLKKIQKENLKNLVMNRNMDDIYGELHVAALGLISCYVDEIHIPVTSSKEVFEEKLYSSTLDEFCLWAISLQSKEQLVTHGHINFWYFEKLKKALEFAGFKTIEKCESNQSSNDFDLSLERSHRKEYSLIVEAKK